MSTPATPDTKPNSLSQIFQTVSGSLAAKLERMGLAVPSQAFGERERARVEAPPRIVWVPMNGRAAGALNRHGSGIDEAWALWGRNVRVAFHVWGEDQTAAEVLANHLVASLHDIQAGFYTLEGEEWDTSKDTKFGEVVVLTASIYTLWSRELIPSVANPTQVITGHIDQPS